MIVVRMVFQARPGRSADLVANVKETIAARQALGMAAHRVRLFTDLSGPYDCVVEEVDYDSLDAFMKDRTRMRATPEVAALMARRSELLERSSREYYTVEFEQ